MLDHLNNRSFLNMDYLFTCFTSIFIEAGIVSVELGAVSVDQKVDQDLVALAHLTTG